MMNNIEGHISIYESAREENQDYVTAILDLGIITLEITQHETDTSGNIVTEEIAYSDKSKETFSMPKSKSAAIFLDKSMAKKLISALHLFLESAEV